MAKLKKQFSEDLWCEPPQLKFAWDEVKPLNDEVIVKKCKEIRRESPKLTRHASLEKDSILSVKKEKEPSKRNLQIFLAHPNPEEEKLKTKPKYLQPLIADMNKPFQLRKTKESPRFSKTRTIVVVPLVENAINVEIRPMTAQSRREKFQKRSNSAFNRPPLIRSSSAPSIEKPKFLASKRKLKKSSSPKGGATEWKNPTAQTSNEIVTMISLISPTGSDNEESECEEPKSVLKKDEEDAKRKPIKSVSFQPSSIHAIRSFSANIPSRRGSIGGCKQQEKRTTHPGSPDANERVPKRRLVKIAPPKCKSQEDIELSTITIDIHAKTEIELDENIILIAPKLQEDKIEEPKRPEEDAKEEQCWAMYCKMTDKGINVSYDTILRGMLTPTEYRVRRTTSIAEEMNLMMMKPSGDDIIKVQNV